MSLSVHTNVTVTRSARQRWEMSTSSLLYSYSRHKIVSMKYLTHNHWYKTIISQVIVNIQHQMTVFSVYSPYPTITIQQSRSFEGICVPLRLMNCLLPVPDSQPTATEFFQSPLYGSGTVFRSISHLLRHFLSSALAWRHTSLNSVTRNYCCRACEVTLSFMDTLITLTYLLMYSLQSIITRVSLLWYKKYGLPATSTKYIVCWAVLVASWYLSDGGDGSFVLSWEAGGCPTLRGIWRRTWMWQQKQQWQLPNSVS